MTTIRNNLTPSGIERWRPIPGWAGLYSVSNRGRVRRDAPGQRTQRGRICAQYSNHRGYRMVTLSRDDRPRNLRVHRLVAAAWLPTPTPKRTQINHLDGDKGNNAVSNIEWASAKENTRHAIDTGLMARRGNRYTRATT